MITIEQAREMALSMGVEEFMHFDKLTFRANGHMFCNIWLPEQRMMIKLSLIDQSAFSAFNPAIIYPVPNKWGLLYGSTIFELREVREDMLLDAITTAWQAAIDRKKKYQKNKKA